ncbi:MAG TPA: mercuric reductase, partial [Thermomicrobiales bacterium]|nr:mercuric reductase [Thermomicrobiales bacterium]
RSVAIIEQQFVGGTCINYGCMPTKTMVASARVAHLARRGRDFGVHTAPVTVDLAVVRERKRAVVEQMRSGSQHAIEAADNVDLIFGEATFLGPKRLRIARTDGGDQEVQATKWIFINTGARPNIPIIPGIETVPFLDSTSIMELDTVPDHLIVLGGGSIGLEFAQMFRCFGSEVTVLHRGSRLLSREDPEFGDAMRAMLEAEGITVMLKTSPTRLQSTKSGVAITCEAGKGENTVEGSHLLIATGRQLNSDRLNVSAAGVEIGKHGEIVVNKRLETTAPGIFALGDVTGGPAFTHISYDDFRIVRDNLLHGGSRRTDDRPVPYVIFTDPELGRVGINETEAIRDGIPYRAVAMGMDSVARAIVSDETTGLMKALIDPDTDQILGATVFGVHGGEIMTQIQLAMMGQITASRLGDMIIAHPTLAEAINNLVTQ